MIPMYKIMQMGEKELRPLVAAEAKKARKRANRILKSEDLYTSPALARAKKSKTPRQISLFETRGKNLNQLRREYKRIKNFMEDETSTVSGTKKFYKKAAEKLSEATSDNFSEEDVEDVFTIFNELEENNSWIANSRFKYEVFTAINDQIAYKDDKTTKQDIIDNVSDMLDRIYQENMDFIESDDEWSNNIDYDPFDEEE